MLRQTYTWKHGRQLDTVTKSGNYTTYHYDGEGKRTQKIINGEAHTFTWVGDKIVQENYPDVEKKFFYDAQGRPDHFTYNGELYYYVLNIMGDVTHILDQNGNVCGSYLYDAWGKTVYRSGYGADLNPIRYRSYFYDGESGLYYLQSRYYDPEIGRFISADAFNATGQGFVGNNVFAYCNNNPVVLKDSSGTRPVLSTSLRNETKKDKKASFAYMNKRDITEKLDNAMRENAEEFSEYCEDHNYVDSSLYFANQVKPGGDWDFKAQDDWMLKDNTTYIYNGTELRYDDVGNIHYGYVGRVLFSTDTLLLMGGVVQIYAGTSSWSYIDTYFDDPRDQWAIQYGCTLWDTEALS